MTPRIRVAVLAGGRSSEHEISRASARSVVEALDPDRYETRTIDRVEDQALTPFLARFRRGLDLFRRLHHGSLHRYLLYMLLTLTALLLSTIIA